MRRVADNLFCNHVVLSRVVVFFLVVVLSSQAFGLTRIRDIARPLGERDNALTGLGLVVGLKGTGDGGDVLVMARPLLTMLQKLGNPPVSLNDLRSVKNVALVSISAKLGRNGAHNGDKIDVTVSAIGKASSLAGGFLFPVPLQSTDIENDSVYAWADGPITIPDEDYPTTGKVANGGVVEVDFQHNYVCRDEVSGKYYFDLVIEDDQANWQTAKAIATEIKDINTVPGAGMMENVAAEDRSVTVFGPRTIRVWIPDSQIKSQNYAGYIGRIMGLTVNLPDPEATIVINEKAGVIVITANIDISPCAVTVEGMNIRIITPKPVPQADKPIMTESEWAKYDTAGENTAEINALIEALDQLRRPVKQKMDVIYELKKAGALRARIKVE